MSDFGDDPHTCDAAYEVGDQKGTPSYLGACSNRCIPPPLLGHHNLGTYAREIIQEIYDFCYLKCQQHASGIGIRHRQLAHGELKWSGRGGDHILLAQVAPGMCTPSLVKLGPLGARYNVLTENFNCDMDTDAENAARTSSIPIFSKVKVVRYI